MKHANPSKQNYESYCFKLSKTITQCLVSFERLIKNTNNIILFRFTRVNDVYLSAVFLFSNEIHTLNMLYIIQYIKISFDVYSTSSYSRVTTLYANSGILHTRSLRRTILNQHRLPYFWFS